MDINVNNLDLGYEQCEGLNRLANNKGQELMSDLSNNIANLRVHWVGNDAMMHINNLIELHSYLGRMISAALEVTSNAADAMIAIQEIRRANGATMGNVGTKLPSSTSFNSIANVTATTQYYVEPAAVTDLNELKNIQSNFNEFMSMFKSQRDELFSNWKAGANKGNAEARFQEFVDLSNKYNSYLDNAIDNLEKATKNISYVA